MPNRNWLRVAVWLLLVFLAGCGGGGSNSNPVVIRVQVSPSQVNVKASSSQLFQASVSGTSNHAVLWQVDGVTGGSIAAGMIDETGVYSAPDDIPSPATVTITAISQADSTKSASATATITIGVVVLPTTASLNVSSPRCTAAQQFTVNVTGTSNSVVDWTVNGIAPGDPNTTFGSLSTMTPGLYTSPTAIPTPPSFKVTATSQADPTQSGSSVVTISAGGPAVNQAPQGAPIQLGTSGGNAKDKSSNVCCSGTLGALVTRNGVNYILSNNHVLAREDSASVGEAIVQPGLVDNSCAPATPVAHFSQAVKLQNSSKTAVADAALAQVVTGEVDTTGAILQLGAVSCGVAQPAPPAGTVIAPAVNMPVAKSGRSTGLTCGAISLIDASLKVQYSTTCGSSSTFTVTFHHQVVIDSSTFGAPGDSGALIVDSLTAQPVALLVGGDSSTGITVANPIQDVLNALPDPSNQALPTFVGGATHPVSACAPMRFEPHAGRIPEALFHGAATRLDGKERPSGRSDRRPECAWRGHWYWRNIECGCDRGVGSARQTTRFDSRQPRRCSCPGAERRSLAGVWRCFLLFSPREGHRFSRSVGPTEVGAWEEISWQPAISQPLV